LVFTLQNKLHVVAHNGSSRHESCRYCACIGASGELLALRKGSHELTRSIFVDEGRDAW
jgi:hypothetical protein